MIRIWLSAVSIGFAVCHLAVGQVKEPVVPLRSLKGVPVPEPPNLNEFVRDRRMAIALGKAFFWDMQVGSDGVQACASCHFQAGADPRTKNQLSPATARVNADWEREPDTKFLAGKGPNGTLTRSDFPFRKLSDPSNRSSAVLSDTNNIVSSQGIHKTRFISISGSAADNVAVTPDPIFHVSRINVRQVPNRSTPTVINAVFNFRQFWDGRAQNEFNGVNPWGDRDPRARVARVAPSGAVELTRIRLINSSLASQAAGPPTSDRESSSAGRTFADIADKFEPVGKSNRDNGKRMKTLRPLARQLVASDDSVLGPYSAWPSRGLKNGVTGSYVSMIQQAFHDQWWKSTRRVVVEPDGAATLRSASGNDDSEPRNYSVLEYNFGLFFGLAIQMYEATLVSDDTPFDRFMSGTGTLTAMQMHGLNLFNSDAGRCVNCHGGAEFTNASVTSAGSKMIFRRASATAPFPHNVFDTGFNNIGVRPTTDDVLLGSTDPWGVPLSLARRVAAGPLPPPLVTPPFNPAVDSLIAADGAAKTPGLRNVELTAPYFHNGGQLTLRQVIDFYARGGDFEPYGREGVIFPLRVLPLSDADKDALVEFMRALTDERVRHERAPFDHPELFVPDGQLLNTQIVINDGTGKAIDFLRYVPPVGRGGRFISPKPFLE